MINTSYPSMSYIHHKAEKKVPGKPSVYADLVTFYDSTKFDIADSAGNLYNRLVIMDARCIHSAGPYFGQNKQDGRLTHLFFFD